MHDWIEIDDFRYCACGTLEYSDGMAYTYSMVKLEDVSKDKKAVSEFKSLADGMGIHLN